MLPTLLAAVLLAACERGARAPSRTPAPPRVSAVAAVRRMALRSEVEVEGVVTVPSATMDAGFALQDASGGIYVSADSGTGVAAGTRVRVRGTLGDTHGMLALHPSAVVALGPAPLPAPQRMPTGGVSEASEGRLVWVRGAAQGPLQSDLPYGYKLWVDDASGRVQLFLPASGGFAGVAARRGQVVTATGLSAQYDSTREVLLRSRADLRIIP